MSALPNTPSNPFVFRARKIVGYIRMMEKLGVPPRKLLAGTSLDPKQVYNPEYLVSLEQYENLIANVVRLSNNPAIAFSLGELVSLNDFGIVGYAMVSARTLREALNISIKYTNSLVGRAIRIDAVNESPHGFDMVLSSPIKSIALYRFEMEELMVRGIKMVPELTGFEAVHTKVTFSYGEPSYRNLYEEHLKCPLEFNAPRTVISIRSPGLDTPIRTMDAEVFQACAQECRNVMKSLGDTGVLRAQLRQLFLTAPGKLPDIKTASAALGVSVRSLIRKLGEYGQTYQEIKDEFRFDLARDYLSSGHMSPKQVAYSLGFSSPSVFSRAFKMWSGLTASDYVKAHHCCHYDRQL